MASSEVSSNLTGSTLPYNTKRILCSFKSMRVKAPDSTVEVLEEEKISPEASILSIFHIPTADRQISNPYSNLLRWYPWWLKEQLRQVPSSTLSKVVGHELPSRNVWTPQIGHIFCEVAAFTTTAHDPSIDKIVQHILARGLMQAGSGRDSDLEARNLIFAIIGWQTMLYRPALGTSPPQQFAIVDEQDGYRGQAFMSLKQCQGSAKRPLHEFLLGFGILLPPPNLCTSTSLEVKKSFAELKTVEPSSFNAFLLSSIGRLKIEWVDVLSCHLEVDERANVVFMFRYPSFCIACSHYGTAEKDPKTVIQAAAALSPSSRHWACEQDITQMLNETLLSYRLLFGQDKPSRKLFKRLSPFACIPLEGCDTLLFSLCGQKSFKKSQVASDRNSYDLHQQFPVLRSRIANLHRILSANQPRGWREIWHDRRDSAGWYTFWVVLIFGVVSIVLSALQVLLQIIQISINR